MSETLQNIAAVVVLALSIIFLVIVLIAMFSHTGPDERDSRTRYNQNNQEP